MTTIKFNAKLTLGGDIEASIPFSMKTDKKNNELGLIWDDVYDAALTKAGKIYSSDDFPNMDVKEITILIDGGEFRVVPEDFDRTTLNSGEKVLVLPYILYSLAPLFKLYLDMEKRGLVGFAYDEDKMKMLVGMVQDYEKNPDNNC